MALQLYMLGLTVENMDKALEFYRHLGLAFPESANGERHIEVKMKDEFTLFLDSRDFKSDNPALTQPARKGIILEFYLKSRAAVDAKYNELVALGYQSYHTPFIFTNNMYFAFINDPEGNIVLLSGDLEESVQQ